MAKAASDSPDRRACCSSAPTPRQTRSRRCPARKLPGIGLVAETRLRALGIDTSGRTIAPTSIDVELRRVALELSREARSRDLPIRLLGVVLARLHLDAIQLPCLTPASAAASPSTASASASATTPSTWPPPSAVAPAAATNAADQRG